jgi:tRNA(Ile)-lysidine synthase
MRLYSGSGPDGLAAMPALAETARVRLLRPLLTLPPARLRATARDAGMAWVEDPSNTDPTAQRARLRALRQDRDGIGPATRAAVASAAARGRARAARERAVASVLARRVHMAPEGYAVVTPRAVPAEALAALLRAVGGADWAPSPRAVAMLAARLRPATLGGVRVLPAGRLHPGGWLLVREAAATAPPRPVADGTVWDGRFWLEAAENLPGDVTIGPLGTDAAQCRDASDLPAAALHGMPAIRQRGKLVMAPCLRYAAEWRDAWMHAVWVPPGPVAAAPFAAPGTGLRTE